MSIQKYQYTALDPGGARRKGSILAADDQDAYRKIVGAGLTPLDVNAAAESRPLFSWQKIKSEDVVGLTRELAVLVEARIPLDRGLVAIAEHEGKAQLSAMVRNIAARIEAGEPLTKALEAHRAVFGEVFIETVRAGEKSGNLIEVMIHLADLLERQLETRQQVHRAMMYPAIVMTVVGVALTIIVVFVVPRFAGTFASRGVQMPLATRVVQGVGESVKAFWYLYVSGIVGVVVAVAAAWSRPAGRFALERFLLRVPYVRRIIIAVTTGRFARVLSIALASGLDLIEAVQIGGRSSGRPVFAAECQAMAERLRGGEQFVDVLRASTYTPSFAKRMLGAGKDSAELAKACGVVARHYDREAAHLTKNINSIVEPLLTVAMAGIVLLVALAVFLPMWKMSSLH